MVGATRALALTSLQGGLEVCLKGNSSPRKGYDKQADAQAGVVGEWQRTLWHVDLRRDHVAINVLWI